MFLTADLSTGASNRLSPSSIILCIFNQYITFTNITFFTASTHVRYTITEIKQSAARMTLLHDRIYFSCAIYVI